MARERCPSVGVKTKPLRSSPFSSAFTRLGARPLALPPGAGLVMATASGDDLTAYRPRTTGARRSTQRGPYHGVACRAVPRQQPGVKRSFRKLKKAQRLLRLQSEADLSRPDRNREVHTGQDHVLFLAYEAICRRSQAIRPGRDGRKAIST